MTQHEPGDGRPEEPTRTSQRDSGRPAPETGEQSDDEDLGLRVDTEEWQEGPSPHAEPPAPESVAERMTGPETSSSGQQDVPQSAEGSSE